MKLALAATSNGLPSLLTAESLQHFLIELVLAAPTNSFPSLLTAFVKQDSTEADPTAKALMMKTNASPFMMSTLPQFFHRCRHLTQHSIP
jgi:hypothetical protein